MTTTKEKLQALIERMEKLEYQHNVLSAAIMDCRATDADILNRMTALRQQMWRDWAAAKTGKQK